MVYTCLHHLNAGRQAAVTLFLEAGGSPRDTADALRWICIGYAVKGDPVMSGLAGNALAQEIRKCMTRVTETGPGTITAQLRFPGDFIGFQGHFPGNPVLPGVCKVQAVVVLFEELHQQPARIREILSAKFFAPVGADEEVTVACTEEARTENEYDVRATLTGGSQRIAKLALRLALNPET